MCWNETLNDDNGSLFTGAIRLWVGDLIQLKRELNPRVVSYVMGSDRNGWRACTKGYGAFPVGPVEWRVVSGATPRETEIAQSARGPAPAGVTPAPSSHPAFGQQARGSCGACACIGYDSAWTERNVGAVAAVSEDGAGRRQFHAPVPLQFGEAAATIAAFVPKAELRVLAIDQPTIVANQVGSRPVERAVGSVIGAMEGGVQPANRSKIGMFDDNAPIWGLLRDLGYPQEPTSRPRPGSYVLEVYPCLNILGLMPHFLNRRKCAKYNPTLRSFDICDWQRVCQFLAEYGVQHQVAGLNEWALGAASLDRPCKADQDGVDAALASVVAFEWAHGGPASPAGVVIGDTDEGYMFTPAPCELVKLLSTAARKKSVPLTRLW